MSIGNSVAVERGVRSLLLVVGLATGLGLVGTGVPAIAQTAPQVSSLSVSEQLQKAVDLLADNKIVAAKNLLTSLTTGKTVSLSAAESQKAFSLLANANRRLKNLSPIEVSLQTAQECLNTGDYRLLTRHADAVIASPKATNEQTAAAKALLAQAEAGKAGLISSVGATIDRIHADFEAGRITEAKAGLDSLNRSGVALSADQEKLVTTMQTQVVEAEQASRAAPGMMQPGVIKPRNPQPAPAQPAPAQPAAEPAPVMIEPPPAAAAPVEPPPATDVIQQARAMDAQSILAQADLDYERALFNDAILKYQTLLGSYAGDLTGAQRSHVEGRLAEAKVRIGANVGPEGQVLQNFLQLNKIKKDESLAQFGNNMEQARLALASGDVSQATEKASAARLNINSAREFFTAPEVERYNQEVDALFTTIERREREIAAAEKSAQAREQEEKLRQQQASAAETKSRKISEAIQRVRALQAELKYEEALQVCEQILFLDPINPTGLILRDAIADTIMYRRERQLHMEHSRSLAEASIDNREAMNVPTNIMQYPTDWPAISQIRGEPTSFQDTEENKSAYAVLSNKRVPVDFQDNTLESVVAFIGAVTNLNIDTDWEKLSESGIDKSSTVTLRLTNVPVRTVLDRVLEKVSSSSSNGAAYAVHDGVLMISTKEAINKNKTLQIYDIKDLLIEVPDYANAPDFDLQSVLQNSGQGGGSSQSPFREQGDQDDVPRTTLEERTNQLIDIITTNVDSQGWQENGGDVGFIQQLQGSLIITNTPANHRAINGLLNKLREIRAMQINVETRFLLVRTEFFEQIGFDLDIYFNGENNQVRAARAALPNQSVQPSDFFDFSSQDPINRRIFGAPTDANGDGQQDPQVGIATPLPSPLSVIGAAQNSLGLTEAGASGSFAQTILAAAPALGVAGQFMDDVQVDFLIKATQADRRTVALTAPRLTFTNGQTSNIYVATQIAFVSDLTPVVSESAVGFDPELATVNEGVRLVVEGTISADRRYVTMNVDASVAKVDGFRNVAVSAVAGGGIVNSASTQSFIQLPTVTVTRVQTTVTVPDQGTIMLGGQRLVTEQDIESGVPVLSKIPIVNRFFSNRIQVREEQTLLILIKPTILIQNEEEERFFPGLADSVRFGG